MPRGVSGSLVDQPGHAELMSRYSTPSRVRLSVVANSTIILTWM